MIATGVKNARWRERSRLVRLWRLARTRRPRTFNEKVRYKMLRDHRQLLVTFADKAAVRDYVTSMLGDGFLPKTYGILDDPTELRSLPLPDTYVVKPSHGSGAVIIVSPRAPADARLPAREASWVYRHVPPAAADRNQLVDIGSYWLSQLYGQGPNREWAYGGVPRRLMIEELLAGPGGEVPEDYKLFVFHGRCRYIQVDTGRFGRRTQDFYRPGWDRIDLSGGPPWAHDPQPPPARLVEMVDLAEQLGGDTDFVRVDLYAVGERIVVGELTNYPAGGDSPFHPEHFNAEFGRHWSVPRRYR